MGKPTNWGRGKNNVGFEVFSDVKHNVFMGCCSSSLPLPSPTDESFCPSNEAIMNRIQPFCTEKCVQLCFKIVREMNHWSISGIFNYYSLCCTETIMAAMSLCYQLRLHSHHRWDFNSTSYSFLFKLNHYSWECWSYCKVWPLCISSWKIILN